MPKVMLIDGNSLAYRAFFALPTDLATASGQITNAVLGFTSMLINLWRDHRPDSIVVAFDRPEPTFRHARVPTYKGTRESAPDILRQQMGLVREVLEALSIPTVDAAGYEADDIVATLATEARDEGSDVIIVTGRPRRLPTGGGPQRAGALQPEGRVGLCALRRGGNPRTNRGPGPRTTSRTRHFEAIPATTCRECPAWAPRPRPSSSTSVATSTASSPRWTN